MPTIMMIFVQATYILAIFVHFSTISAVTEPILTIKAKSRHVQGKFKARSTQGQRKVRARSKQGQGKVKAKSR